MQRRRRGRAAALQDFHFQPFASPFEGNPQAGRRRLPGGFGRAEQHHESTAGLGGDRKAPQLFIARALEPGDERMAGPGAQHLLRRPERIAPARRMDHGEMREIDARRSERGCIRQVRRREPHDPLPGRGKPGEGRQHELELADSFLQAEDFGQGSGRPAAARQAAVKLGVACGNGLGYGRQRLAAPDRMLLQDFVQGGHRYCI